MKSGRRAVSPSGLSASSSDSTTSLSSRPSSERSHGGPGDPSTLRSEAHPSRRSCTSSATSVGLRPTRMPAASSASALAWAVPLDPEMIAPA
jgi:hypothetical protein